MGKLFTIGTEAIRAKAHATFRRKRRAPIVREGEGVEVGCQVWCIPPGQCRKVLGMVTAVSPSGDEALVSHDCPHDGGETCSTRFPVARLRLSMSAEDVRWADQVLSGEILVRFCEDNAGVVA